MGTFSGNQCRQNWWEEMLRCPNFGFFSTTEGKWGHGGFPNYCLSRNVFPWMRCIEWAQNTNFVTLGTNLFFIFQFSTKHTFFFGQFFVQNIFFFTFLTIFSNYASFRQLPTKENQKNTINISGQRWVERRGLHMPGNRGSFSMEKQHHFFPRFTTRNNKAAAATSLLPWR